MCLIDIFETKIRAAANFIFFHKGVSGGFSMCFSGTLVVLHLRFWIGVGVVFIMFQLLTIINYYNLYISFDTDLFV